MGHHFYFGIKSMTCPYLFLSCKANECLAPPPSNPLPTERMYDSDRGEHDNYKKRDFLLWREKALSWLYQHEHAANPGHSLSRVADTVKTVINSALEKRILFMTKDLDLPDN